MINTDLAYLRKDFTTQLDLYRVINAWNVSSVRSAIDLHDLGRFVLSGALSVVVSRYAPIFGALRQRKAPPLGLAREVTGADAGPGRRARDDFAAIMMGTEPLFGDIFFSHAMLGFAVLNHTWVPTEDASTLVPRTKVWPCSALYWNSLTKRFVASTLDGPVDVIDGDGKWSVYTSPLLGQVALSVIREDVEHAGRVLSALLMCGCSAARSAGRS